MGKYEEALERAKAKAYDEALEWMRDLYPTMEGSVKEDAEHYFPELKESEDERIARELLEYAKDEIRSYNNMVSGDYDGRDKEDKKMHEWWKKVVAYLENQKEQKPSTPEDIAAAYQMGLAEGRKEQKPAEWSEDDEDRVSFINSILVDAQNPNNCAPHSTLYRELEESRSWLKTRFKSLHPQPHWKPSEEQMDALLWCAAHLGGADHRVLAELYEHLKMYCP